MPHYRILNEVNPLDYEEDYYPENAQEREYLNLLKKVMEEYERYGPLSSSEMTRRKRASPTPLAMPTTSFTTEAPTNKTRNKSEKTLAGAGSRLAKRSDRQKRAYRASPIFLDPKQEAEKDFLTRKYFKNLARSIGNKRMAFARFEAQKRSSLENVLENPQVSQFIQDHFKGK